MKLICLDDLPLDEVFFVIEEDKLVAYKKLGVEEQFYINALEVGTHKDKTFNRYIQVIA